MAGRNANAGEMLMDMKLADLIGDAGRAIAEAQASLDASSIRLSLALAESRVKTTDAAGVERERSLIELGFMPSFYHFSTASFTFNLSITTRLEQSFDIGLNVGVGNDRDAMSDATAGATAPATETGESGAGGTAAGSSTTASGADDGLSDTEGAPGASTEPTERSVMFGACFNIDYHHKYGYDATASTQVVVNLSAVPAPAAFRDFVSSAAASGATSAVTTT